MSTDTKNKIRPLGVTQQDLKTLFVLNDGVLYWKIKRRSVNVGDVAGELKKNGRWKITVNGRNYQRSRLVWLYVFGEDSYPLYLDHINRKSYDDRIENLRKVTHSENQKNRSWGGSSCRYVYPTENGTWRVRVSAPHGRVSLGCFGTEEEAIKVVGLWEGTCQQF